MNTRQKAKKYKGMYERLKHEIPRKIIVRDHREPTITLKACILVSPEEMEAGIPYKRILARKFTEALEEYMTIENEGVKTPYTERPKIRLTGTIKIVGGKNSENGFKEIPGNYA